MKIAIIQCSNGKQKQLNTISIKINKLYAKFYNYDYFYNEYTNIQSLAEICFQKFIYILKYIKNYDYIVYIDMDAAVANPNIKIQSLLDIQHHLFIVQDLASMLNLNNINISNNLIANNMGAFNILDFIEFNNIIDNTYNFNIINNLRSFSNNPYGINAGFYILKNSQIIQSFINDCLKYKDLFLTPSYDQDCIARLLQLQKYENIYKLLDYTVQGNYNLNNNSQFRYDQNKNFICHCSGITYEEKIKYLQTIFDNKYWIKFKELI